MTDSDIVASPWRNLVAKAVDAFFSYVTVAVIVWFGVYPNRLFSLSTRGFMLLVMVCNYIVQMIMYLSTKRCSWGEAFMGIYLVKGESNRGWFSSVHKRAFMSSMMFAPPGVVAIVAIGCWIGSFFMMAAPECKPGEEWFWDWNVGVTPMFAAKPGTDSKRQ